MHINENRAENVFEAEQSAVLNYQQPILFCDYCSLKAFEAFEKQKCRHKGEKAKV